MITNYKLIRLQSSISSRTEDLKAFYVLSCRLKDRHKMLTIKPCTRETGFRTFPQHHALHTISNKIGFYDCKESFTNSYYESHLFYDLHNTRGAHAQM